MRVLSQLSKTTTPRLIKRWAGGLAGVGNHNSTLKLYQESHHSSCKMIMTIMCPPPPASRLFSSNYVKGGKNNNLPIIRCFNSLSRAFPSYSILGEKCLFAMKPILPKFKHIQQGPSGSNSSNHAISLMQKGRMLLEFTPTNEGNQMGFKWKDKISFALNVEEMGLLLSQLPHYSVTFSRRIGGEAGAAGSGSGSGFGASTYDLVSMGSTSTTTSTTNDYMDKVLTVQPGDGATVTFHIDYVKDGVGGQKAPAAFVSNEVSSSAPLQVVLQAGEWEVIATLLRDSIPHLLGWNQLMNVAVHNVMNDRGGGGGGGDYGL